MTRVPGSAPEHHSNNLDAVRIIAAMCVIVGHSFALTGRPEHRVVSWTPTGPLGVYIFFAISGYLVVESWRRDPSLTRFILRRSLRIFPGLAVCIVLTAFLLGPLVTTLSVREYLAHPVPYRYLWNIALYVSYDLPGVFLQNPLTAVNGSLWSLPLEFALYLLVAAIGIVRGNRWVFLGAAVLSGVVMRVWASPMREPVVFYGTDIRQFFVGGIFFWAGAVYREFDLARRLKWPAIVMATLVLVFLNPWREIARTAAWILLPAIVLGVGLARTPALMRLTRTGDYSYGIYIYAFPVQQIVAMYWPQLPIGAYILLVTAVVYVLAIMSWHFIEAPALRLKPRTPTGR